MLLLASIVLMVIGYRGADFVPVYTPLPGHGHLNNLLMLVVGLPVRGRRHQGHALSADAPSDADWGTVIWAVAHLLVNGDLASVVLFGGLGPGRWSRWC